jgi:hypothetical protein
MLEALERYVKKKTTEIQDHREVVANRRDVKRRTVNVIVNICEQNPGSALQGNRIDPVNNALATTSIVTLWRSLSAVDINVLRTAKGCHTRPPNCTPGYGHTFADLLQIGGQDPYGSYCWGSWINNAYEWAVQIIDANPRAFPDGTGERLKARVATSIAQFRAARGF